jgi:integrase
VRGSLWQEIDLDNRLWTIPGYDPVTGRRTKAGETHLVPLSDHAIAVLREARLIHGGSVIFPGSTGRPLSDNTLSKTMRDACIAGTPHGFLSASFSSFKLLCLKARTGLPTRAFQSEVDHRLCVP